VPTASAIELMRRRAGRYDERVLSPYVDLARIARRQDAWGDPFVGGSRAPASVD
jgi:hypothetical protein